MKHYKINREFFATCPPIVLFNYPKWVERWGRQYAVISWIDEMEIPMQGRYWRLNNG